MHVYCTVKFDVDNCNLGGSAAKSRWISRCLESGHPVNVVKVRGRNNVQCKITRFNGSQITGFYGSVGHRYRICRYVSVAKKLKKGMATAKQRLGKKLKIHKMIFWLSLNVGCSSADSLLCPRRPHARKTWRIWKWSGTNQGKCGVACGVLLCVYCDGHKIERSGMSIRVSWFTQRYSCHT